MQLFLAFWNHTLFGRLRALDPEDRFEIYLRWRLAKATLLSFGHTSPAAPVLVLLIIFSFALQQLQIHCFMITFLAYWSPLSFLSGNGIAQREPS